MGTTGDFGPRRTDKPIEELSISGYLMPAHADRQPVLIGMAGTDDMFIMLFSTEEKLRTFMNIIDVGFDRIQIVMNGADFIASIEDTNADGGRPYALRIVTDPYKHDNGNWRFTEILGETN